MLDRCPSSEIERTVKLELASLGIYHLRFETEREGDALKDTSIVVHGRLVEGTADGPTYTPVRLRMTGLVGNALCLGLAKELDIPLVLDDSDLDQEYVPVDDYEKEHL